MSPRARVLAIAASTLCLAAGLAIGAHADTLVVSADTQTGKARGEHHGAERRRFIAGSLPTIEVRSGSAHRHGSESRGFLRFDLSSLPGGATIDKAVLRLWTGDVEHSGTVDVLPVLEAWEERTLTPENTPMVGSSVASFGVEKADQQHFVSVDVTALVRDWLSGVQANYGLALVGSGLAPLDVTFDSKENELTSHAAEVELVLGSVAGTEGPQGPVGPTGPTGPPGPSALVGYEVVSADSSPATLDATALVSCPAGKLAIGGGAAIQSEPPPPQSIPAIQATPDAASSLQWDVGADAAFDSPFGPGSSTGKSQGTTGLEGSWTVDLVVDFDGGVPSVTQVAFGGRLTTTDDMVLVLDQGNITGQVTGRLTVRPSTTAPAPVANGTFVTQVVVGVTDLIPALTSSNPLFDSFLTLIQSLIGDFFQNQLEVPVTLAASVDLQRTGLVGDHEEFEVRFSVQGQGEIGVGKSGSESTPLGTFTYNLSATGAGQIALQAVGTFVRTTAPRPEVVVAVQQSFPVVESGSATGWQARATELVPTEELWRLRVHAICIQRP
jgi:TGF-beta propeptide